jgi:two-component sensor histidine kinase
MITTPSSPHLSVLLVEDNPGDADLIRYLIAEVDPVGFTFRHETTLGGGLAALSREPFEVILLDLTLPDSTGLETVERMVASAPGIPVVILTGNPDDMMALQTLRGKAQDCLIKGDVSGRSIIRAIRYARERKHLQVELEEANARLRQALHDNEILLKEIHHRIKNNLSLVASLLSLQTDLVHDPRDGELLQEARSRVMTMARIHENLYRSSSLTEVDAVEYLQSIACQVVRSGPRQGIDMVVIGDEFSIGTETAVPLGLMLNELVTNTLKHAFPDRPEGLITIHLNRDGGDCVMIYRDNGVGLPAGLDPEHAETLGLMLITSLVHQLSGSITMATDDGARFDIRFPIS